jgi:DNA-binding transcriptional LysR family regulator
MVDLRSLEVFFWVVKLGGFGRAAERLHMTQPAVSGRISQIEAHFAGSRR